MRRDINKREAKVGHIIVTCYNSKMRVNFITKFYPSGAFHVYAWGQHRSADFCIVPYAILSDNDKRNLDICADELGISLIKELN